MAKGGTCIPRVGNISFTRVATLTLSRNQLSFRRLRLTINPAPGPAHAAHRSSRHTSRDMIEPSAQPPPQSGEEVLQELLARGLSQQTSDDPASYCRLLQVLFEHCILKPLVRSDPVTPAAIEQVDLTLTILQRQTTARPELLSCATNGDTELPLYKWILPRLIYAAGRYEELPAQEGQKASGHGEVVEGLLLAGARLISVLSQDLENGDETNYAKGAYKSRVLLEELVTFCESECPLHDGRETKLTAKVYLNAKTPTCMGTRICRRMI